MIHASAGVATSAQAMAYAWEAHYLSACTLTRLSIFPDPPSICGDSGTFIDCVCFSDPILMIAVCAYNLCARLCNYSLGLYVHSHHECPISAGRSGCILEVTPTQV